jgi:hypothetical protein
MRGIRKMHKMGKMYTRGRWPRCRETEDAVSGEGEEDAGDPQEAQDAEEGHTQEVNPELQKTRANWCFVLILLTFSLSSL